MDAIKTLSPNQWLGDEVINSMLILLPPLNDVLVLDSLFYPYLARGDWESLKKHNTLLRNGPKILVSPVPWSGLNLVSLCT